MARPMDLAPITDERATVARRRQILIQVIAIIAVLTAVGNAPFAFQGSVPAMVRTAVALLGLAGALLLQRHQPAGWRLARSWAALQIPHYAWSVEGPLTTQCLYFPLAITFLTNALPGSPGPPSEQIGINVVGIIFFVWLGRWRDSLLRPE